MIDGASLRPEQDFQNALRGRSFQSTNAVRERVLFANHAFDIHRVLSQQLKRRTETPAARADHANLVNDDARGINRRRAMKG